MHHGKSQHIKTSNASQSDPLSFVYFYPQLGRKKTRFLPSCFMGKNYFPGKAGDMPFVRDKAFYEEKPFSANAAFLTSKLNSYLFITECKPCRKQQSCNYCIYYSLLLRYLLRVIVIVQLYNINDSYQCALSTMSRLFKKLSNLRFFQPRILSQTKCWLPSPL